MCAHHTICARQPAVSCEVTRRELEKRRSGCFSGKDKRPHRWCGDLTNKRHIGRSMVDRHIEFGREDLVVVREPAREQLDGNPVFGLLTRLHKSRRK